MKIVTREQWGALPPRVVNALPVQTTRGLAAHYSGTAAELGRDGAAVMREHQSFHMRPVAQGGRGWFDIAYSFEVDSRGTIYVGRGWGFRTAANGTTAANDAYFAVCYQGADKAGREDFTRAAAVAFGQLCADYKRLTGRWPDVPPHSALTSTSCPGDEIRAFVALRPWESEYAPTWPVPLPRWFWRWNAWRLGEGAYASVGPKHGPSRASTGAPRLIPPWAWARAIAFDRARRG